MTQSHIIEIDGLFAAAAVAQKDGYRIVAIDPRVEALDGSVWPTLDEATRSTESLIQTG